MDLNLPRWVCTLKIRFRCCSSFRRKKRIRWILWMWIIVFTESNVVHVMRVILVKLGGNWEFGFQNTEITNIRTHLRPLIYMRIRRNIELTMKIRLCFEWKRIISRERCSKVYIWSVSNWLTTIGNRFLCDCSEIWLWMILDDTNESSNMFLTDERMEYTLYIYLQE